MVYTVFTFFVTNNKTYCAEN